MKILLTLMAILTLAVSSAHLEDGKIVPPEGNIGAGTLRYATTITLARRLHDSLQHTSTICRKPLQLPLIHYVRSSFRKTVGGNEELLEKKPKKPTKPKCPTNAPTCTPPSFARQVASFNSGTPLPDLRFTIPVGTKLLTIISQGASGGDYIGASYPTVRGGLGGFVQATFRVKLVGSSDTGLKEGEVLTIAVGGEAYEITAGINGGGSGSSANGGGGGGFTSVRRPNNDFLVIAGGGGGAARPSSPGGAGGGPMGGDGGLQSEDGRGGTQIAGGIGGSPNGQAGSGLEGGDAGVGGGGGGGYYGGGGGSSIIVPGLLGGFETIGGSGGGGSSFISLLHLEQLINLRGVIYGDGLAIIIAE